MSNLIKYNNVVLKEKDNVVIDSNQKILDKLNSIKKLLVEDVDNNEGVFEGGFISGLNAPVVEELVEEAATIEEINAEAENILNNAREEAEAIISQAKQEADGIRLFAKNDGYNEGKQNAQVEFNKKLQQLEKEYSDKNSALETEYQEKVSKLEPQLVDTLLRVFSRVTHTMAEDKKDIILSLINNVMHNVEMSREFYIRVSSEDYKFVLNNQSRIYSAVAKDVNIEIAEDSSLKRNDCIIETDAGVFDCSLDIQLDSLIRDIKLLSCMNN